MFYCNDCAEITGWPDTVLAKSKGPCEMCGRMALCNDCPSSALPDISKQQADMCRATTVPVEITDERVEEHPIVFCSDGTFKRMWTFRDSELDELGMPKHIFTTVISSRHQERLAALNCDERVADAFNYKLQEYGLPALKVTCDGLPLNSCEGT